MKQEQTCIEQLEKQYTTDIKNGLTSEQVQKRQEQYGPNMLPEAEQETWLRVFLRQFQSPLIYMLVAAAFLIFFIGEDRLDAFIISGILLFNAVIGTIQEGRTRSILQSLKRFIKTDSVVIRDGERTLIDDVDIVPGDILLLQEGQRIPADAYVVSSNTLQVDEAILTGESKPVYKYPYSECEAETPDNDAHIYKGTYILSGSGIAVVTAIGDDTQIGQIHRDVQELDTNMPLKQEVDRLTHWLLIGVMAICAVLFAMGLYAGQPLRELLVMLTALFICVVPEGLPVVMTLVLVSGVYRMAKQNVLIKRMQAVEGLGRTDVLAIDKTGTLTRNELMVSAVITNGDIFEVTGQGYYKDGELLQDGTPIDDITAYEDIYAMAEAAALLNSTQITYDELRHTFDIKGDPTEAAMFVFAQKVGDIDRLSDCKKIYEIPFDPKLQYHAGFFKRQDGTGVVYVIGAPEYIFSITSSSDEKTDDQLLETLLKKGLRVVAVASKSFDPKVFAPDMSEDATFDVAQSILQNGQFNLHGLFGIQDAIRPDVPDMVQKAKNAGLMVIMATGDHKDTALYVAKEVGIYTEGNQVLTGKQFGDIDDQDMLPRLDKVTVYARFLPNEKMRLVQLFHQKNRIIAMTGDGINDAPALVAADLGIAMGGIGTEVAKKAADLILIDDSFGSIIRAIEQGRHIFYTLKRVILYFFATNMGEVLIVLFALLLNAIGYDFPLPLTAAQILWLNLVTDGFLDISLSMEPQEKGLLQKKWLRKKIHLVDWAMVGKMFFYAMPMAVGSMFLFFDYYQTDLRLARTMTLLCMAMFQWFNAWNCRSENKSLFTIGFFTNKWLILATAFVLFLQFVLIYAPFMQFIFKTVPLTMDQWFVIIAITAPIVLLDEIRKFFVRIIWPEG